MSQANKISGYTIARNVVKFKYPIRECMETLRPVCEDVVFAYDPYTEDGTDEVVKELAKDLDLTLFESRWDMSNIEKGLELGVQTDIASSKCRNDWKFYLQLDEGIHEDDVENIKAAPAKATEQGAYGIDFQRIYFYGNLHTIRDDWTVPITRLTYGNTHTYAQGDGMSCVSVNPRFSRHLDVGLWMFHYSRIGDPEIISQRIRNLDGMYHDPSELLSEDKLPAYDFITRQWDNYGKDGMPPEVQGVTVPYHGTHPLPFAELYQDWD